MENKIENILFEYNYLIPKKEYAGIITLLFKKTQSKEIDEVFTYNDIELCAYQLKKDKNIQIEKALQFLLTYFLRKHKSIPNSYFLTQYAKNFIALISDKIDSPYRNLPLKQNFEKYFQLDLNEIQTIENLRSWFELGFNKISKNIVSEHIESLQDELNKSTTSLNNILHKENLEALQLVGQFSEIFKTFGAKSREIREVLNLKNSVLSNLRIINTNYYNKLDSFTPRQRENNLKEYGKSLEDWEFIEKIISEVNVFFNQVDVRLDYISDQILYASKKLDELHDTFDRQSLLKINLKKMLRLVLECAEKSDNGYSLGDFPEKMIPYEDVNILAPKLYDFEMERENTLIKIEKDAVYEKAQKELLFNDLNNQERTSIWVDNLEQKLESESNLDLTREFQNILSQEKSIDIPIQVSFDVLNSISRKNDSEIIINRIIEDSAKSEIKLWKIIIKK